MLLQVLVDHDDGLALLRLLDLVLPGGKLGVVVHAGWLVVRQQRLHELHFAHLLVFSHLDQLLVGALRDVAADQLHVRVVAAECHLEHGLIDAGGRRVVGDQVDDVHAAGLLLRPGDAAFQLLQGIKHVLRLHDDDGGCLDQVVE